MTETHVVHQHVQLAILVHVFLDDSLGICVLHQVTLDDVAFSAFLLLDLLLDLFGAERRGVSSKTETEPFNVNGVSSDMALLRSPLYSRIRCCSYPILAPREKLVLTLPSPEAKR